jgi:hypothetical protein
MSSMSEHNHLTHNDPTHGKHGVITFFDPRNWAVIPFSRIE